MSSETITEGSVLRASVTSQARYVCLASVFLIGHQTGEALVPVLVGAVIDNAVTTGDAGALAFWLLLLGLDFAMLSFSYRWGARRSWLADVRADQRLRLRVTGRVLDPRGGAESGRLPGSLATIAVADAKRVGVVNFALPLGVAAAVATVVVAVALLRISLPLGLLILLGTPPLLLLVHLLGKPVERRSGPEQERGAQAAGVAADLVAGVRVLKGIGAEPAAVRRYVTTSREALSATLRATRAQAGYQGAVLAANGLFLALVALVGGRLAMQGEISVGGLVAAVGLAQFLIGPLQIFGWVNGQLAQGRASAARIATVLSAPTAVGAGSRPAPVEPRGELRLRALTHGPLDGLELAVRPGELLGVAADPHAATALLRCLGREAEPDDGAIELDGVPLAQYTPADARRLVLVATHDAELFAGTLRENVLAGAPPGRDPAPAMAAAQADQVAGVLPDGMDTAIAEQGRSLSGGQRQRVALARALAADVPVLVLHDPTTAVDAVTEARIAAALREVRRGRTTIVLATSPALLGVADRVVVLERGRLRAEGTHHELLHADAGYRAAVLG
ncbi:ABC transporter transmembrane domain-containing protein [Pseudonocardia asaccharolytica]|uniref:Multidrug ABC transporter ATP-binding protein n=1 Tax=Pseudonocardia asaccharolytica DSM 44247 = NBRC 16224 TaxID=1123024 RepID=A0A511D7Q1_9PSEU|nr:ABC transporter ATP-binding protein [Pseudonocardia asaccharolytica]GEL20830.1 multidrug ABC transporter ATP-binding protein [Pseudonocardia asaccharolytica DSM 44247 = NBRC 16224]